MDILLFPAVIHQEHQGTAILQPAHEKLDVIGRKPLAGSPFLFGDSVRHVRISGVWGRQQEDKPRSEPDSGNIGVRDSHDALRLGVMRFALVIAAQME